jgi:[ribosomal protein S18]-alanine N-acetyltransferase
LQEIGYFLENLGVFTVMDLSICKMNMFYAADILGWKYEEPYDFYNNELTEEALRELLNGSYHAVVSEENQLIGFYCTGRSAQVPAGDQFHAYHNGDYVDIGLGMRPELTGKRLGFAFCSFIIHTIQSFQGNKPLRLTVAKFNQRAIHLYKKHGFTRQKEFVTDSGSFIVMVKKSFNS